MVNLTEFRLHVIRPALTIAGLHSPAAESLVLFTGLVESGYQYLKQINGPALGFWQEEPRWHEAIKKWLNRPLNAALRERILATSLLAALPNDDALIYNLRYACLIARLNYWQYKAPLPAEDDAVGMAAYHKKYYNTYLGKADVEKNSELYREMLRGREC